MMITAWNVIADWRVALSYRVTWRVCMRKTSCNFCVRAFCDNYIILIDKVKPHIKWVIPLPQNLTHIDIKKYNNLEFVFAVI